MFAVPMMSSSLLLLLTGSSLSHYEFSVVTLDSIVGRAATLQKLFPFICNLSNCGLMDD